MSAMNKAVARRLFTRKWEWPKGRLRETIPTCAHLDQNPTHNDPTNLAALCPRCHLRHDRRQHIQSAYRNRRKAVGGARFVRLIEVRRWPTKA